MRNLQEYYQFNIEFKGDGFGSVVFLKIDNSPRSYNDKLTPSQWKKADKYLTRKLIPFCGYIYRAKDITKKGIIKII